MYIFNRGEIFYNGLSIEVEERIDLNPNGE